LSELIDQGEGVVITRHGRPMVELKPVEEPAQPMSAAELHWLAAHRVGRAPTSEDAGRIVERMRDESER